MFLRDGQEFREQLDLFLAVGALLAPSSNDLVELLDDLNSERNMIIKLQISAFSPRMPHELKRSESVSTDPAPLLLTVGFWVTL